MTTKKTSKSKKSSEVLEDVAVGPDSPDNGKTKPLMASESKNPIVKEREPDADNEVATGKQAQAVREDESYVIPVNTKNTKTEFRVINH